MTKPTLPQAALLLLLALPALLPAQHAALVDPMLGTDAGGNTFPGATLPFGMLKAGPDTGNNTANAGWTATQPINGFSQTHVSGTGGGAKYGNLLLQPTTGEVLPTDHASPRAAEHASAGTYAVTLTRFQVAVEVAAARRSALYRFTYPAAAQANLLLDAGHCLHSFPQQGEAQSIAASAIQIVSPTEITGLTRVTGGWNKQPNTYTVFFYAVTDTPATATATWVNDKLEPGSRIQPEAPLARTGAALSFPTRAGQVVQLKIGISFLSIEQARRNAIAEIPNFDFPATQAAARQAWNQALAPVTIEGATEDDQRQLYTALYHTMLMPTDRTGENPLFASTEPSYDDFFAIWDTFRSSSPLLTLIAQPRQAAIVRSLVDLYRHEGWMPDARSGNYSGRVQGGSDQDMTIVDGFLKHLPGVDWTTAYQAVLNVSVLSSPCVQGCLLL